MTYKNTASRTSETNSEDEFHTTGFNSVKGLSPNSDNMAEVFGETSYGRQVRKISPTLSERVTGYSYPDPDAPAPTLPYPDHPSSSRSSSTFSEIMARRYSPDPNKPHLTFPPIDHLHRYMDPALLDDFPAESFSNISQAKPYSGSEALSTPFGIGLPTRKLPDVVPGGPSWLLHASKPLPQLNARNTHDPQDLALSPKGSFVKPPWLSRESKPLPVDAGASMSAPSGSTVVLADPMDISEPAYRLKQAKGQKALPDPMKKDVRIEKYPKRETYGFDPLKKWVKLNPTKGGNDRMMKTLIYNSVKHYEPLPEAPESWGCFKYEEDGELENNTYYTVKQIEEYLFQHPLHRATRNHDPKQGGLTIWIQKVPADSARRYSTKDSSRCRFERCFADHNTINQGQYRVALDEQSFKMANHDPMHDAGYVHLYCLEKFLDLPLICQMLDVRSEDRFLPNELDSKNRMIMSTAEEQAAAHKFIQYCKKKGIPPGYPDHKQKNRPHEGTLTHELALTKMANERDAVQKQKSQRGLKPSINSEHLGNLEVEAFARAAIRKTASLKAWKEMNSRLERLECGKNRGTKRGRDNEEDSEEEEEEEEVPALKRRRRSRKAEGQKKAPKEDESDSGSDVIYVGVLPEKKQPVRKYKTILRNK